MGPCEGVLFNRKSQIIRKGPICEYDYKLQSALTEGKTKCPLMSSLYRIYRVNHYLLDSQFPDLMYLGLEFLWAVLC